MGVLEARVHLATLVEQFDANGSQTAFVTPVGLRQRTATYSQLARLSRRFAAELAARGIKKGERVILWGENSAEWVAAFFGCVLRGVLPVPLDAGSSPDFARRVAADTQSRLIVADPPKLTSAGFEGLAMRDLESLVVSHTEDAVADLRASDPLQIIFTSGTTTEPKGVVHTHGNVLASLWPIESEIQKYRRYERIFHPLRFLHTLPLSHVFGQFMGLWIPPLLAAEVHFHNDLVASRLVERIRGERISVLACVPRVLDLLHRYLGDQFPELPGRVEEAVGINAATRWWRFRRIHRIFGLKFWAFVCGGASLPSALEQFWSRLGFLVVQGYGMTETTALVSLNHPFRAAAGTIGQVLPGREVRLSDDGELLVRGDTISNATWRDGVVETRAGEWLATGDLAEFDASGNLRFKGRKKETIVTASGLNIYPEDLEAALLARKGIRAAAVIEGHDPAGAVPHAVLALDPGANATSEVEAANAALADFQKIRQWTVWPEADLPRTSTGKISKREIVARLPRVQQPDPEAQELSLDSLGRVELQARIEQQYGVTLDDNALRQVKTSADLQQLIAARPTMTQPVQHRYWHWPWNPVMQLARSAFIELIAMPLVRFLTRARVQSLLAEVPKQPMLIVANHITSYDAPFVLYALPRRVRTRIAVAMSGEMLLDYRQGRNQGNWMLNALAPLAYLLITALFNVFPLPREAGIRRSFRHAGEAIDHGYSVLVFPEGRRSEDGTPQPFRTGAGLLWKELGVPALAIHIAGLGEIKAMHTRWFRRGNVTVSTRALLPPQTDRSPEELTKLLESAVFGLAD